MQRLRKAIGVSALIIVSPACAGPSDSLEDLQSVYDYSASSSGLSVRVPTGGCTDKNSFIFEQLSTPYGRKLILNRTVPDRCKGNFPEGTVLEYSWEELGISPSSKIILENPVQPPLH